MKKKYNHHIIETNLEPGEWIDTDTRMLHGVMALVQWFVENDMQSWTKRQYDKECERIRKEEDAEYRNSQLKGLKDQYEGDLKIIGICKWWKNYPKRLKEIQKATSKWWKYASKFKDSNHLLTCEATKNMNDKEKAKERKLLGESHNLKEKIEKEEQEMLKLAVELRGRMWS